MKHGQQRATVLPHFQGSCFYEIVNLDLFRFSVFLLKRTMYTNMDRYINCDLTTRWGRWEDILYHSRFKRNLTIIDVDTMARAMVSLAHLLVSSPNKYSQ